MIAGEGVLAEELRDAAAQAGYEVRSPHDPTGGVLPALIVDCDREPAARARAAAMRARATGRAHAPPQGGAHLVLCRPARSARSTRAAARSAFTCSRRSSRRGWSS